MTKPEYIPVIDNKDLVRDSQSKAILSTNKTHLEEHRQKKKFFNNILKQAEELDELKKDINEIKSLLHKLLTDK